MSNYEALGFSMRNRREAEGLARAPVRHAPPQVYFHQGEAVAVHRLEVGEGVELWSLLHRHRIVAAFPHFMATTARRGRVARLSCPASVHAPRVWLNDGAELAFQLVNHLACTTHGLAAGTLVEVHLSALAGRGLTAEHGEPGLWPASGESAELENCYHATGMVTETRVFANRQTGVMLRWLRLSLGPWGPIETVCRADATPPAGTGDLLGGEVTLRGTITDLPHNSEVA